MNKINRTKKDWVNLCIFSKETQLKIKKNGKVKKDKESNSEFAKLSIEQIEKYLGKQPSEKWSYMLIVDFDEETLESYNGVKILKGNDFETGFIITINTGDIDVDTDVAINALYDINGEVMLNYSSSYDDYMSLLEDSRQLKLIK